MIWDLVGLANPIGEKGWGWSLEKAMGVNSTWNTTLGDSIANIIGGGRFTNIFGTDAKIVFDWEEMLMKAGSMIPGIGKGFAAASHGTIGGVLFGIGGDTSMVFGNKTSFTYFTEKADCEMGVHKIEVNYQVPTGINILGFKKLGARGVYYLPVIVAILGVLVMTGLTLALKYYWKYTSSNPWTVDMGGEHDTSKGPSLIKASTKHSAMENAMLLYPLLENRWLWVVKFLHTYALSTVPLKIGDELGEAILAAFETSEEVSVLRSQLKDIEEKITLTKNNIATYETQIKNNIEVAQAVPLLAGIAAQGTKVLMEEMDLQAELLMNYQGEKVEITKDIAEKEANAAQAAAKLAAMRT